MPTFYNNERVNYPTGYDANGNPIYTTFNASFLALTPAQQGVVTSQLPDIQRVANVQFTASSSPTADIGYGALDTQGIGLDPAGNQRPVAAFAYPVGFGFTNRQTPEYRDGDVWFYRDFVTGRTALHETLHSLGLQDTEVIPSFPAGNNDGRFTMMSYKVHPGIGASVTELQLYDIAALQYQYGQNTSEGAGSTTYTATDLATRGNAFSLWDASGTADHIDLTGTTRAALVDLRPGFFSSISASIGNIVEHNGEVVTKAGFENISLAFGSYIENATGGSGADILIGNAFNNELRGGNGADLIYGDGWIPGTEDADYRSIVRNGFDYSKLPDPLGQVDKLFGEGGNDIFFGGRGNDAIDGGSEFDTVSYAKAAGAVTISYDGSTTVPQLKVTASPARPGQPGATIGVDTLTNIEMIKGSNFADTLEIRGSIRSTFTVDAGKGPGDKVLMLSGLSGAAKVFIDDKSLGGSYVGNKNGTPGRINLVNFNTTIIGSAFDDDIYDANPGPKHLDGGDGNDWIEVTQGDAVLIGGAGDDILWGGSGSDRLHGGVGDDEIDGGLGFDWADYSSSATGVFIDLAIIGRQNTGQGVDVIVGIEGVVGSAFADTILGTASSEIFEGGAGADRLEGFGGDDTLNGGAGVDTLIGGAGNDAYHLDDALDVVRELAFEGFDGVYFGGIGTYTLTQYVEDLILVGPATGGIGNEGGNGMFGNAAANRLEGMLGDDRLFGAAGDDQLFGQGGNDDLRGELGNDGLFGGQGDDFLDGGDGDDSITGGLHQDILVGGAGVDFMQGNDGNDVLNGGGGADQMYGGFGADRFDFFTLADSVVGASDRIHDFSVAEGDLIDLSRIDADQAALGDQAFIFVASFSGRAGEAVLTFDGATNTSVLNLDVNGDGVSDFRLEMTGSVGTSQGWVL